MLMRDLARIVAVAGMLSCCGPLLEARAQDPDGGKTKKSEAKDAVDRNEQLRNRMVKLHLAGRGIKNERVLDAFRTVPRHKFLPPKTRRQAYDDESIPIGAGQTITPPYDVAFMTEVLDPKAHRSRL